MTLYSQRMNFIWKPPPAGLVWAILTRHVKSLPKSRIQMQAHPAVLLAHCELHYAAKEWKSLLTIAETLLQQFSELDFLWVNRSYALHELKQTQAAFDALVPAAKKFPKRWLIRYNLACYCSQLGRMDEAMQWLQDAMTLGNQDEITAMALDDPDLKPLWRKIRGI